MVVLCPCELYRLTLVVVALHRVLVCPIACGSNNSHEGVKCHEKVDRL